jgi:hypothetical protein
MCKAASVMIALVLGTMSALAPTAHSAAVLVQESRRVQAPEPGARSGGEMAIDRHHLIAGLASVVRPPQQGAAPTVGKTNQSNAAKRSGAIVLLLLRAPVVNVGTHACAAAV